MPSKKIGRPTSDPKTFRIDVRVGKDDWDLLEREEKESGKSKPNIIRELIKSLKK